MKIKSTVLSVAVVSLLLAACSSLGPPQERELTSPVRMTGKQHDITLFRRFFKKQAKEQAEDDMELVGDPEYQEFLEWKRWQEFKAYQDWKKNNPAAATNVESGS